MTTSLPSPDFRALFQSAPGLYLVLTPDLKIVAVSDAYLRATMTKRKEILGRGLFDVFPDNPNDPQADGVRNLKASLDRVLKNKAADTMAVQKYDIRRPESEGGGFEERYWSPVNTPVLGSDKHIAYIIHQVEDVTARVRLQQMGVEKEKLTRELQTQSEANVELSRLLDKLQAEIADRQRAQEALRQSEEKFSRAFRSSPDSIAITTLEEGRYIDVNDGFLLATGYSREEVIGRTARDLNVWSDPAVRGLMVGLLREHGQIRDFEFHFQTKSGETRIGLRSAELIELNGETCIIGITRDITNRVRLEEQLRQSQKMEAVGQLAGGVAHDFNNLLGVILGYAELLEDDAQLGARQSEMIQQMRKAAQKAALVTRQLLAFGRKQILELAVFDLNTVVGEGQNLLRRLIRENIELEFRPCAQPALIRADRTQVDQVLMNLAVNARDAMPQGGKLTIEISNADLDEAYAQSHYPVQPGRYVVITVTDTGVGMDEKTQARIFEPFFTTKGRDEGTGLGLATVYGIVKQSGGYIWVYSEVARGTVFKIYLPRVEDAPVDLRPVTRAASYAGTETVLLVEDSGPLRKMYQVALQQMGYTVLEAENGASAIEIARRAEPIHILVTDLIMPGITGRELAKRLQLNHQKMKVLHISGYAEDTIGQQGTLEPGIEFLQKPFSVSDLGRKIREVLANGG